MTAAEPINEQAAEQLAFSNDPLKVIDVHKMYADRATAIRTLMLTLVSVATAGVSAVVALRDNLSAPVLIGLFVYAAVLTMIAGYLKWRIMRLIDTYEKCLTVEVIYQYQLLPIDALHGPLSINRTGEDTGAKTYSVIIMASAAVITTIMLIGGVVRLVTLG